MSQSTLTKYAVVWICSAMLASSARAVDGTVVYDDNFVAGQSRAESVSCAHSRFWSQDVTPLPGSYLFYVAPGFYNDGTPNQGLVFIEDENWRAAELCYVFSAQTPVTAQIDVNAAFPKYPSTDYIPNKNVQGHLSLQAGPNGTTWTGVSLGDAPVSLTVDCPEGLCYIRLLGNRAVLKRLCVTLFPRQATKSVSTTSTTGYKTIQAAIDAASDGDIIEVARGIYSGAGNRDIDFKGKKITVRSEAGTQATILDCSAGGRGFYFHRSENTGATLSGFTIQNGKITSGSGGGIYCESGSSPTIINCVITGCIAENGGGIAVKNASPRIIDCVITNCTATNGGGIHCDSNSLDNVTFGGCSITGNKAKATGGGVYCSNANFQNCLVVTNSAATASGLYANPSSPIYITNCTIARNTNTGSTTATGCVASTSSDVRITSCIVWGNDGVQISGGSVTYSDVQGGCPGDGNLNGDPAFVNAGDGRYQLLSTSPCVDKGNPSILPGTEPYPNSYSDMGAYGASPQATKRTSPTIYHVWAGYGRKYNNGLSKDSALDTIQGAVDKAVSGDTILIWPGSYTLTSTINFNNKALRIQSAADAAVISCPSNNGWAFSFNNPLTSSGILSNLIITGCKTGAIYCDGSSPTLKNLTIVGNACGLHLETNASPNVINCLFWNNGTDLFQDQKGLCSPLSSLWKPKDTNVSIMDTQIGDVIVRDPCFADASNGDYHLQSPYGRYVPSSQRFETITKDGYSLCIDAGSNLEYPRAERAPNGSLVDVGAHGGTPYASKSKN
jgi:hypothetical protein